MDQFLYLYAVVVLIAAALAGVTLWASRSLWSKVSALCLAGLLMASGYAGLMEILGRPKPVTVEWSLEQIEEATVVASRMREGEAIYLWLEADGAAEPRAYALPWSLEDAKQLNEAMREGEAKGTAVRMRAQSDQEGIPEEPLFYAEPQPALPEKVSTLQ